MIWWRYWKRKNVIQFNIRRSSLRSLFILVFVNFKVFDKVSKNIRNINLSYGNLIIIYHMEIWLNEYEEDLTTFDNIVKHNMRKFFWLLKYHDNRCDFSFVMDFQSFTVLTVQNLSSVIPERIGATAIKIISRFSRFNRMLRQHKKLQVITSVWISVSGTL